VIVAVASTAALGLAGLAFGLWEQTRYLLWVNAHPGWVARPGELTRNLRDDFLTGGLPSVLFPLMLVAFQYYRGKSRRMSLDELRRARGFAPVYPIAQGWSTAFVTFGLFGLAFSLWVVTAHIRAYVWEGTFSLARALQLWIVVLFSAQLALAVIREQLGSALGLRPVDDVPLEQASDAVREALVAGRRIEAIRIYQAQTGADQEQARRQVLQLADAMYREHPERFARDPTLPAPIRMRRLGMLTLTGALAATVAVQVVPPAARVAWADLFAVGVAAGVVLAFARRWRSRWQRVVMVLCTLGGISGGLWVGAHLQQAALHGVPPTFIGLLAGFALIVLARRE
jgi:hypothetical protein